jgi:hypothetical protein
MVALDWAATKAHHALCVLPGHDDAEGGTGPAVQQSHRQLPSVNRGGNAHDQVGPTG